MPYATLARTVRQCQAAARKDDLELPVQGVTVGNTRRTPERTSPLYLWLAQLLRDQIEAGQLGAHNPVPSERVLGERYDVSRMTARHALETLTLEGYLYRHPRRGTYPSQSRGCASASAASRAT